MCSVVDALLNGQCRNTSITATPMNPFDLWVLLLTKVFMNAKEFEASWSKQVE